MNMGIHKQTKKAHLPSCTGLGLKSVSNECTQYRIAGYFRGTKFSRIKHFADFIFEDRGSFDHNPTVNNDFEALNFRGSKVNSKTAKMPRK